MYEANTAPPRLLPSTKLSEKHPQNYYKYCLIDPIDTPFATFRYYLKTIEDLQRLGIDLEYPINIQSQSPPLSPPISEESLASSSNSESGSRDQPQAESPRMSRSGITDDARHGDDQRKFAQQRDAHQESQHYPVIGGLQVSMPGRPLSAISEISERASESTGTGSGHVSPLLTPKLSRASLKGESQSDDDESFVERPATLKRATTTNTWPLDTSKPLPDLPSGEVTPRPRGGQGSSHQLLVSRFPKFASSSALTSMSTLRSSVSDAPSDPFVGPPSPAGRGDPLPLLELSGGLRSHPPDDTIAQMREAGFLISPSSSRPSSKSTTGYANSLNSEIQRNESVDSIGRAISRPKNQRPPTPADSPTLNAPVPIKNANRKYIPRLGTPPVFFPQQTYSARPSATSDAGPVIGLNQARSVSAPYAASSSPDRLRRFPVRKSSLTGIRSNFRRFRGYSDVSFSQSLITSKSPLGLDEIASKSPLGLEEQRFLSSHTLDEPKTTSPNMRADLTKFFGEPVYSDRDSSESSLKQVEVDARVKRKGSLFAFGKGAWDNLKNGGPQTKEPDWGNMRLRF